MSTESPGGPPEQPGSGPQSPGGPPPAGSGGPPPPPPPAEGGPQSGPPPAAPGYAGPQSGPAPGYAGGPMVATSLPPVLQGREFAGYGARAGAWLIDGLIGLVLIITIVGPILYPAFTMARKGENNGQTLGKQWLGIRVIREDGQDWEFGTALLREFVIKALLFGFVGGFLLIGWLIDLLWPLWDEKKQALHDKVASSYVVTA